VIFLFVLALWGLAMFGLAHVAVWLVRGGQSDDVRDVQVDPHAATRTKLRVVSRQSNTKGAA